MRFVREKKDIRRRRLRQRSDGRKSNRSRRERLKSRNAKRKAMAWETVIKPASRRSIR